MPWLSRHNSTDEVARDTSTSSTRSFTPPTPPRPASAGVSFIPAQIDGLCGTSPTNYKQNGSQLLLSDLRVLFQNLNCLPAMARSLMSTKVLKALMPTYEDIRDNVLQCILAVAEMWMLILAIPAFLILPGSLFAVCVLGCWALITGMTWSLNGPAVVYNRWGASPMTEDERWIFVNGMMSTKRSMKAQSIKISASFGRPVLGLQNQTSGLMIDLITMLLQRSFNISTPCSRQLTTQLRDACLLNSVRKVILIGHGTGGIAISQALDALYADLPVDAVSKLEIYTFGSAASYLNNPCLRIDTLSNSTCSVTGNQAKFTRPDGSIASPVKATLASLGHRIEDHERVIPHIEHYVLSSDIFARIGVLHNVRNVLDNRFCGRVFIIDDSKLNIKGAASRGGGFMLTTHYFDLLFPKDLARAGDVMDLVVDVDFETAEKREFTAQGVAVPLKSVSNGRTSPLMGMSPDTSPNSKGKEKRSSWGTANAMGVDGVGKARMSARECEGRTVRQLSRLWRFAQGGRPVGEGVAIANGVGKPLVNGEMGGMGMGMGMGMMGLGIVQ